MNLNLLAATLLRFYPRNTVSGIRVIFTDPNVERGTCLSRLSDGLRTLESIDPRRYRGVHRFVAHIVVWPGHFTAYDSLGGIQLASWYLLAISDLQLASALVHEATHLRIAGRGIEYRARNRERIERLCVKEQAAFLRQVSPGHELAADIERALSIPWWTEEMHAADMERVMSDAGLPAWLGPLLNRETK